MMEEKKKCIKDYVDTETAVGRNQVGHIERATKQKQENMTKAENAGQTTTMPETTFEEMLNTIGDSLSDLASFDNAEDGDD
jgi:hypothetical protein